MRTSFRWRVSVGCLALCAWSQSAATTNQIVGVTSSEGGSCLVKRFRVQAGSVIQGVEFVNNDDQVVFPCVMLLRGPATRLSEAMLLAAQTRVSSSSRHRVRVTFAGIPMLSAQDVLVVVRFPASTGVRGIGDGVGIGATRIDGPGNSYVAPTENEEFQWMDFELGISLLLGDIGKPNLEGLPSESDPPRTFLKMSNLTAGGTTLAFGLRSAMPVRLILYDIAGRRVRTLVHQSLPVGVHTRNWDGLDQHGGVAAAGVYIAKLWVGDEVLTQKFLLLR